MSYDNTNRGTMGKNKKPKTEKSPPYVGKLNVEGIEYWVSGWVQKNGQTGESFFSLSVQKVRSDKDTAQQGVQQAQAAINQPAGDFDDDIPFS